MPTHGDMYVKVGVARVKPQFEHKGDVHLSYNPSGLMIAISLINSVMILFVCFVVFII